MRRNTPGPDVKDLPREIPVFPLNGALLLPGGKLPLNIFEDRYLNMVRDTLSAEFRGFGMIQTAENPASRGGGQCHRPHGALRAVGCLGRLSSFEETDDGRYLIALDGLVRFRVVRELEEKDGYRRVAVSYDDFTGDVGLADPSIDRTRLLAALHSYFDLKGFSADWRTMDECDCEKLVTTLSMICPFSNSDKQALLEAPSTVNRADVLTSLLEMEVAGLAPENKGDGDVIH